MSQQLRVSKILIRDTGTPGRIEVSLEGSHSAADVIYAVELLKISLLNKNRRDPAVSIPGMLDTRTLERVRS